MIIRLTDPIVYTDKGFECAAWWREMASDTGDFEIEFKPDDRFNGPCYMVNFPATVLRDNFQSLFCGNRIGASYDESKNTGQRMSFLQGFPVDAFVTDPRFIVTPENIEEVCNQAMTVLGELYTRYRNWVLREITDHETYGGNNTRYDVACPVKFLGETLERLHQVETFHAWHLNTWKGRAAGLPIYRDVIWHGYPKP